MQENDRGKPTATKAPPWGWGPRAEIHQLQSQSERLAARLNRLLELSWELREMEKLGIPALAEPVQLPLPLKKPRN